MEEELEAERGKRRAATGRYPPPHQTMSFRAPKRPESYQRPTPASDVNAYAPLPSEVVPIRVPDADEADAHAPLSDPVPVSAPDPFDAEAHVSERKEATPTPPPLPPMTSPGIAMPGIAVSKAGGPFSRLGCSGCVRAERCRIRRGYEPCSTRLTARLAARVSAPET